MLKSKDFHMTGVHIKVFRPLLYHINDCENEESSFKKMLKVSDDIQILEALMKNTFQAHCKTARLKLHFICRIMSEEKSNILKT